MEILDAHERLAALTREEQFDLLPVEAVLEGDQQVADCWPAAAVGGLILIGWLANVESDADLREAVRHLGYLHSAGLVDEAEWRQEGLRVIDELLRWGDALPRSHAADASPN